MTPAVIFYLLVLDITYTTATMILMLLVCLGSLLCGKDFFPFYERFMNAFMMGAVKMTKMDVLGLRRQRTVLQFTYETVPQLILQTRILLYFIDDPKQGQKYGITQNTVEWSLLFAVLHIILEFIFFIFESSVTKSSMLHYFVICYNARQGWLPFMEFIKPKTQKDK
jgi:hypothetical protein